MPDRRLERFYLDAFLRTQPELVDAVVDDSGERPDFVLTLPGARLGIEVTRYRPPLQGAAHPIEQSALRDRTLETAGREWSARHLPPVDVVGLFHDHTPLTKARVPTLASAMVERLVAATDNLVPFQSAHVPGEDVWQTMPEVCSLRAMRVPDETWSSWSTSQGGWMQTASEDMVRQVVAAKEPLVSAYRTRAATLWLLITFEHMDAGDVVAAPNTPVPYRIYTAFDRVFTFDVHARRAVEIPTDPRSDVAA